jgi:putative transposase
MRFGYRRLTAMLVGEGVEVNHKHVYRLYREEGLAMRIRQQRRIRWKGAVSSPVATRPNQRWSIDFVSDCVSTGRVIRMLTMVDDCTRECPQDRSGYFFGRITSAPRAGSCSGGKRSTGSDRSG